MNSRLDQEATEFEEDFLDCPLTTPMIAETLTWLGVEVRGEQEWEYGLYRALEEMKPEGLLVLWDRRFQIEIRNHDCRLAWAYFPMHRHTWLKKYVDLRPNTQVLLMISADRVEERPTELYKKFLRHQLGHVLWALQDKWPNECYHATREWNKWAKIIPNGETVR